MLRSLILVVVLSVSQLALQLGPSLAVAHTAAVRQQTSISTLAVRIIPEFICNSSPTPC